MKKDFIDPDLLDQPAAAGIVSPIRDRFVAALGKLVDEGIDIGELETAVSDFLAQQSKLEQP